jgi:hypothetical protein
LRESLFVDVVENSLAEQVLINGNLSLFIYFIKGDCCGGGNIQAFG